jgi:IS1 family transposase
MHFLLDITCPSKHNILMNRISTERRTQVVRCLIEGCSINSTVRMTGVAKHTVLKLLVELGAACAEYLNETMRNLPCKRIQVDEIWQFVGCKQKNVTEKRIKRDGICGDVWTWTAIDADTKLIPAWMLGQRDPATARDFMEDLAGRLANRVQLTSDGLKAYLTAVRDAFGDDIDYSMLVKLYGTMDAEGQRHYSPAQCIGCERKTVTGNPDPDHISTSYIERQNLTMRMSMRRFTRLTNAHSKKIDNHAAAVALYVMTYNFHRKHMTLGTTPAVKARIADHVWSIEEIIGLLEEREQVVAA